MIRNELILDRDLVFFDIESTGLNVLKDRIVQIAMIKFFKNGNPQEELEMLINPGIPIGDEAIAIHGITPAIVRNKPTFSQVANELYDFIGDADLAGYNSDRFDVPMLMEEFARVGLELNISARRSLDIQKIFYKMEPRTLKAALKFYCGEELGDAHNALEDVRATVKVMFGQIEKYANEDYLDKEGNIIEKPISNNIEALHKFTSDPNSLDATQRLKYNSKRVIIFNFGKYIGRPVVDVLRNDKQYYHWILEKDFSTQVKQIIRKIMKDYENSKNSHS